MTFTSLLCLKFTSCCRYIKIVRSCFDIIPKQNLYEPILDHCGSNYNQLWRKVIEHFAKQNDFEKCYKNGVKEIFVLMDFVAGCCIYGLAGTCFYFLYTLPCKIVTI